MRSESRVDDSDGGDDVAEEVEEQSRRFISGFQLNFVLPVSRKL